MIRRPPRSTLFPTRRSSDLVAHVANDENSGNTGFEQAGIAAERPRRGPFAIADKIRDRKSTRLNSSHGYISYAVFCLKKKKITLKSIMFQPFRHVVELVDIS